MSATRQIMVLKAKKRFLLQSNMAWLAKSLALMISLWSLDNRSNVLYYANSHPLHSSVTRQNLKKYPSMMTKPIRRDVVLNTGIGDSEGGGKIPLVPVGGGSGDDASMMMIPISPKALHGVTFLLVLSSALVAFAPVPILIEKIGTNRATMTLSGLSAAAATVQIVCSPLLGKLLEFVGRKPPMVLAVTTMAVSNAAVALYYHTVPSSLSSHVLSTVTVICATKFLSTLSVFAFSIASQTMIADIAKSNTSDNNNNGNNNNSVGAIIGIQVALTSAGFLVGAVGAGQLIQHGVRITYTVASIVGIVSMLLAKFGLTETRPTSFNHHSNINVKSEQRKILMKSFQSPLSCTRLLFRHSRQITVLGVLLLLQSMPMNMGDTFQIFAKTEWNLSTKDYSTFVGLFGVVGIVGNVLGSVLLKRPFFAASSSSTSRFTTLAVASSLCAPVGAVLTKSLRGMVTGMIVGCLSAAQSTGITAALIREAAKSGVPQGELAGEQSSLVALLRILGPLWYSIVYLQGRRLLGTSYLPFVFNILLGLTSLVICHKWLV